MKIDHICLNVLDFEKEKDFYVAYFPLKAGKVYENEKSGWADCYLLSPSEGTKIELLHDPLMQESDHRRGEAGLAHFCLSLGSKKALFEITEKLDKDGYTVLSLPQKTGEGYYEAVFLDPEGNRVELAV
jgi:lactoylglutathione lyase